MFERIPLARWVDTFVRHLQTEYKQTVAIPKQYTADLIQGLESFLVDPNPAMLAFIVIAGLLARGWLGGHFGELVRRHERGGDGAASPVLAASVYAGLLVGASLVLVANLVLHLGRVVGVAAAEGAAGALGVWHLPGDFTLLSAALVGAVAYGTWATGVPAIVRDARKAHRLVHVLGGFAAGAIVGYPVAVLLWMLIAAVGPAYVMLGAFVGLSTLAGGLRLGLFALAGLGLIMNLQLWTEAMQTLALVGASAILCTVVGLPTGIAMSRSPAVKSAVRPALDLMQTMPAYVYLIPAVIFFGIGAPPALLATVMFALPPIVRLTAHGIEQVDKEVVEASDAFGATGWQTLMKAQLPLARSSIMVGVNQMLLLSLSMVVIAAAVGAGGLGAVVYTGLTQLEVGKGFEGGIGIVILAVLIDRVTESFGERSHAREKPMLAGFLARARDVARQTLGLRAPHSEPTDGK